MSKAASRTLEVEHRPAGRRDAESLRWLSALRGAGPEREAAVARLHALLVRAAGFELSRRRAALSHVRREELEDIALQAADDALVSVLARLDDYRGASRFTTWAYKFAILEAGVRLRRRAWQDRQVVLGSSRRTETSGFGPAVQAAIADCLTPHQHQVFVALALDEVPIDVLADHLDTTRAALYETLHEARGKLRARLGET